MKQICGANEFINSTLTQMKSILKDSFAALWRDSKLLPSVPDADAMPL
jgi:hypothetical protein